MIYSNFNMNYAVDITEHITYIQIYTVHKAQDSTPNILKFEGLWQEVYAY